MDKKIILGIINTIFIFYISGCISIKKQSDDLVTVSEPKVEREFRAAWVATVANINWPSKPGISTEDQKKEARELLDLLMVNHFNAVIFQVRPQCDALYHSDLEPWSYYLTGEQGKAPEPYYDPLAFWVAEAHQRGLELHVWLNPYRAHHVSGGEITASSIVKRHPELAVKLKNGYWWLDPGKKGTMEHSTAVVMDIVRRYDVDGVHFDDYFYPYPSYNDHEDFPDDKSYRVYLQKGGKLSRNDWRRENVNQFIKQLYKKIKKEKPYVKFGLSPFGIWRPNFPASISGFDQYDQLYADARLWLNKGWIDYFTPQLYWPVNQLSQSYPVLLGWWSSENTKSRHLWPGMNIGRGSGKEGIDETLNQIMITRGILKENPGHVHWSIGPLVYKPELVHAILQGPYKKNALVPSSPWLNKKAPPAPLVSASFREDSLKVFLNQQNPMDIFRWVLYFKHGENWDYKILNRNNLSASVPAFLLNSAMMDKDKEDPIEDVMKVLIPIREVRVTAVDRTGNESIPTQFEINDLSEVTVPDIEFLRLKYSMAQKQKTFYREPPTVTPGIEVLLDDYLDLVKGKNLGLITNPSAVGTDLRSDIDILTDHPDINLVALFGAEHGVRGAKQGAIFQEGELDPETGIPVYSLYGDSYAPKKEWLKNIDILIFDIQGVGSSWYTFKYSMSFAMEVCAKEGIPFIVLDRPNPLGGIVVEGPLLNLGGIFRHPLPLRHGMTYGELATMWNITEGFGADLTVVKMKGWLRNKTWEDTGLPWIMPSPNMGTYETAVVYPGLCLFERTNISEARGTTKPFLMTGAPWIDGIRAAADLNGRQIPGALFRPVYFIPQKADIGDNPRGKPWNKLCSGVEILLTDSKAFRSVETALYIFDAYRKLSPDSLYWTPPETIKLLENPGMAVEEVVAACQNEISDFMEVRKKYLLYR